MHIVEIDKVQWAGGLTIEIYFKDGTHRIIDFEPWLKANPHPQHNKFANPVEFRNFTYTPTSLYWGEDADLEFCLNAYYTGDLDADE